MRAVFLCALAAGLVNTIVTDPEDAQHALISLDAQLALIERRLAEIRKRDLAEIRNLTPDYTKKISDNRMYQAREFRFQLARQLKRSHPDWSNEACLAEARRRITYDGFAYASGKDLYLDPSVGWDTDLQLLAPAERKPSPPTEEVRQHWEARREARRKRREARREAGNVAPATHRPDSRRDVDVQLEPEIEAGGCDKMSFQTKEELHGAIRNKDCKAKLADFDVSRVTDFSQLVRRLPPSAQGHRIPPSRRPACRAAVREYEGLQRTRRLQVGHEQGDDDVLHVLERRRLQPGARMGHEQGDEHVLHLLQRWHLQPAAQMGHEQGDDDAEHFPERPCLQPGARLGHEQGDEFPVHGDCAPAHAPRDARTSASVHRRTRRALASSLATSPLSSRLPRPADAQFQGSGTSCDALDPPNTNC